MALNNNGSTEIPCPICDSGGFSLIVLRGDSNRIVSCSECGHMYLNPPLGNDIVNGIYKKYHNPKDNDVYIELIRQYFSDPRGPYQYALSFLEKQGKLHGKKVLEFGCGPGRFLYECHKKGASITGVDISPNAAQLAKRYFGLNIIEKTLEQAMIEKDILPGAFDYIFVFEIIEHLSQPMAVLKTLHQLLIPGGLLIVSVPNFYLFRLMDMSTPGLNSWFEHLHFFDIATLTNCLIKCNFKILHITTVAPMLFGERQKQKLTKVRWTLNVWRRSRHLAPFVYFKNAIFYILNRYKDTADKNQLSGSHIIAIAQK